MKTIKVVWATPRGTFDEKREVSDQELAELLQQMKDRRPGPHGHIIFIGDPS